MPIRVLHFADLHLGVENYGRLNPSTGLNSRFEDFARTLDRVVQFAIDQPVDLVLFAGDAYKNRDPSPTHQRTFARAVRRLSAAGIQTVVLVGNHDVPNTRGRAHAVEVFDTLEVPRVIVADVPRLHRLDTPRGLVQVAVLPYRRLSAMAQQAELRGKTPAEMAAFVVQDYREQLARLGEEMDPDIPTVVTAHLCVGGASVGSERNMMLSDEPMVPLSTLIPAELPIDYVALGHIHKFQDMNRRSYPPVVYPGSLERVDFGEENDEKGFVLVQLQRGETTYEFVSVDARPFVTVECDLTSDDPMAELEAAVSRASIEGAVVRLRYRVAEDKRMQISASRLHKMLGASFCVGRVERDIVRRDMRARDPNLTDSLDAYGALQRYVAIKPPPVESSKMLDYGKALIDTLLREQVVEQ